MQLVPAGTLKRALFSLSCPMPRSFYLVFKWYLESVRPVLNANATNIAKYSMACSARVREHRQLFPEDTKMVTATNISVQMTTTVPQTVQSLGHCDDFVFTRKNGLPL